MEKLIDIIEPVHKSSTGIMIQYYEKIIRRILQGMKKGKLTVQFPDGSIENFGGQDSEITARITIRTPEFFRKVVLYGDIGFGEAYVDGDWQTDDITAVISWMIANIENNPGISGSKNSVSLFGLFSKINRLFHLARKNSIRGSRKNISEHYDLSNEFFALWLDKSMTYSSAIDLEHSGDLYTGQQAKYRRLCEQLQITDTDSILEIGCGWGGFSMFAAAVYGCKVTAITISREQYAYVKRLIAENGMEHKITVLLQDYRTLTGKFDKIVSIEMLEAVGHEFLPVYFRKIHELLSNGGAVALQVITSHDCNYDKLRKGVDWIQKYIFPGSLLPSIGAIQAAVQKTGNLTLHDAKNFGIDYAETLRMWRERFNERVHEVKQLNFDDDFIRKWNYYLSYCEAAFRMRNINLMQLVYTRPNNVHI
ncbi:MAG: cyclopropane-fatty-acyl-phospholipid synthase family protein [Ignavibacteria bacterium]|nr:cyclopropane-fatty-acyl-phospholipid synthase family protein [Ignavibacteria bacterium]